AGSQSAKAISRHLSEAEMIALYQGTLPDAEAGKDHLTQCSECLQLWRDVHDFLAPADAEEPEAGEFELRREWKELWGSIQADLKNNQPVIAPAKAETPARFFNRRTALSLAAGVLLTASLSAVTLFWRQERRERLEAQETAARLQTAQQELLARVGQLEQSSPINAQLKQEQEKRQELEMRLAELNQPQSNQPTYELMLARNERGNAPTNSTDYNINVPASAKSYLLRISPDSAETFTAYVIELFDRQNRQVWKSERLKPKNETLSVTVPRAYLSEGSYRLRLTGWKGNSAERIGDYNLKLSFSRK
ncbi:MAG TPA: hypothetical protein PKC13_12320, partial [Blastocatellia bacterium]|nr:hypothetical protein [Blastocatellia bacterium]